MGMYYWVFILLLIFIGVKKFEQVPGATTYHVNLQFLVYEYDPWFKALMIN